jgi:hypothetical protein
MLPNAIFSTLQGTQNPDTNLTLPRAKNANAPPAHPGLQELFKFTFLNINKITAISKTQYF